MAAFMTYYVDAIKNHYIDFKGRATRKHYWLFVLFNFIVGLVLSLLSSIDNIIGILFGVLYAIYALGVLLPSLGILVRRLHDTNRSGWWFFIAFVPLIGTIWLLVLLVLPSVNENNRYGLIEQ